MKKAWKIILIVLVIAVIVGGISAGVLFLMNRDDEEEGKGKTTYTDDLDEEAKFIEEITNSDDFEPYEEKEKNNIYEKYSDTKVTDLKTAKESLKDIMSDLEIASVEELDDGKAFEFVDDFNSYKFSQEFKGLEVYGNGIIVYADKEGNAEGIINSLVDVPDDFNTSPKHSSKELEEEVLALFDDSEMEIMDSNLIIFPVEENRFELAYEYVVGKELGVTRVIVSDNTEEVLSYESQVYGANEEFKVTDKAKKMAKEMEWNDFDGDEYEKYAMIDTDRKIIVSYYDKSGKNAELYKGNKISEIGELGKKTYNTIKTVYDYYVELFNYYPFTGNTQTNPTINVITNCKYIVKSGKSTTIKNNALYLDGFLENGEKRYFVLFGSDGYFNENLEVVGHEINHGNFFAIVGSANGLTSKSVNEAYSDILGMCIEADAADTSKIDGIINLGKNKTRNIKDSKIVYSDFPTDLSDKNVKKLYNQDKDSHYYSKILSKVAYRMNESFMAEDIAKIWFSSMTLLPTNPTFVDVCNSVIITSKLLGYSEEEQQTIINLFKEVGLEWVPAVEEVTKVTKYSGDGYEVEIKTEKTCNIYILQDTGSKTGNTATYTINDDVMKIIVDKNGDEYEFEIVGLDRLKYKSKKLSKEAMKNAEKITSDEENKTNNSSKDTKQSNTKTANRKRKDVEYDGGVLINGSEYTDGQYKYTYLEKDNSYNRFSYLEEDGWRVSLVNDKLTSPIDTELCTSIGGKPIISLEHTFAYSKATKIDVSSFDTSHVTNMEEMFCNCQATEIIGLENWDTSKVITMYRMFYGCPAKEINVSKFNTSNVTAFGQMFGYCKAIKLDTSGFTASGLFGFDSMFSNTEIAEVDLSGFDFSQMHAEEKHWWAGSVFYNCGVSKVYVKDETAKAYFEKVQENSSDEKFKKVQFIIK
ncbi:MAG: BspA family leucine-rich repeat surface protein [Clostridia bacterium]|nr:BspA family leucine-rich repeat surface protein [Clostridia bacterium]